MLPASTPEPFITSPVRPLEYAKTVLPVVEVLPLILAPIWPNIFSHAVNHRVPPATPVPPPVNSPVDASCVDGIVVPPAAVLGAVRPGVHAKALLQPCDELASVPRAFLPALVADALHEVALPGAFVGAFLTVPVGAHAVCHAVGPLTTIGVTVGVSEPPDTLRSVVAPLTLIAGTIRPGLAAEAVAGVALPLACVDGPCGQA
mmetsp:Transcript_67360/g.140751  ORF Transcript_67360/g.140751 Transcript_67360/m.140751 type:complete len:203 (-) Transcript_67360:266-874(-)|eukprot:CAMPEP_0206424542 /NCGR_PEP_ID=MMETSP0324_2-20121206/3288_1 /ASSEMBLY_ACC=CAM_ASM_000836 /TAXON_ID=2866 /ORGANISM="Crypthecodinium cohnii, Strain Seligo" /LENGTH=202 /DNA_ID=CAMNT_0053889213 /DNA_START=58 /DNA_END=666 /DNA_ORIENTATION=-